METAGTRLRTRERTVGGERGERRKAMETTTIPRRMSGGERVRGQRGERRKVLETQRAAAGTRPAAVGWWMR